MEKAGTEVSSLQGEGGTARAGPTWLNLRVKATTFGEELCFSFLFQPQLDSSCKHLGKLMLCAEQHSGTLGSVSHFSKWSNIFPSGDTWEEPEGKADTVAERIIKSLRMTND